MNKNELISWIESHASASHSRSSGPGGQNVNKVNTKVTMHIPLDNLPVHEVEMERLKAGLGGRINSDGELVIFSDETRSQLRNREFAVLRAASLIEGSLRKPKRRKKTRPSRASVEKRLSEKKTPLRDQEKPQQASITHNKMLDYDDNPFQ